MIYKPASGRLRSGKTAISPPRAPTGAYGGKSPVTNAFGLKAVAVLNRFFIALPFSVGFALGRSGAGSGAGSGSGSGALTGSGSGFAFALSNSTKKRFS